MSGYPGRGHSGDATDGHRGRVWGNDRLDKRNRDVCRRLDQLVADGRIIGYERTPSCIWSVCVDTFGWRHIGSLGAAEAFLLGTLVAAKAKAPTSATEPDAWASEDPRIE